MASPSTLRALSATNCSLRFRPSYNAMSASARLFPKLEADLMAVAHSRKPPKVWWVVLRLAVGVE